MFKMKMKIAVVFLIISTLLMIGLPQYTFASPQQGDRPNQPQITAPTSPPSIPRFSINISPRPIYADVGQTVTSSVTVKSLRGFSGTVNLDVAPASGLILKIEPKSLTVEKDKTATATLTVKVQPKMDPGRTLIQVTGSSGSLTVKTNVNVLLPDFSIRTEPRTIYLVAGETKTSTITATSIYHFSGTIALSASTPTGWPAPMLGKNSLTLTFPVTTPPSTDSTTLTIKAPSTVQPGKYIITVTGEHEAQGESKDIVHSRYIVVQVVKPDFRISASPSPLYLQPGQSGSSTIRIASIGRFQGTVQLSIVNPTGLAGTLTSTSLSIEVNQAGTVTLNVPTTSATPSGKYPIQITATSGSLSHVITVMVQVIKPDFAIISSPELLIVKAGATTATAIIKAISINRYEGNVALAATPPAGITLNIDPIAVNIKYNQAGIAKVTFNIPANTEPGKYIIDFKGTAIPAAFSGITVDTTSIKIVVTP